MKPQTRLWRRPENGVFYYRKAVPDRLRNLFGKSMIQISLRTNDEALAAKRHKKVADEVDKQWRDFESIAKVSSPNANRPVFSISLSDAVSLSGELYRAILALHEHDPGKASDWERKLVGIQSALPRQDRLDPNKHIPFGSVFGWPQMAIIQFGSMVEALLVTKQISVSLDDRRRICCEAAKAMAQAYKVLARRASGDWSPDPMADRFPRPVAFVGWKSWYPDYCDNKLPEPSSQKRQQGVLSAFFKFLGHDIPGRVTEMDAIGWMEHRLTEVSHATVRKADLAHPKSFFAWAVATKRLKENPFVGLHVPKVRKLRGEDGRPIAKQKMREYHLHEARQILAATLEPVSDRTSAQFAAAKRWVPWLCAYTGARVGEITQLRQADIYESSSRDQTRKIWVILITPEAGRVKDHEEREVAIHPHLIEQGFLDFVEASPTQTLFFDPKNARNGSSANPQSAKVGERLAAWIRRDLKITDPRISPNHAWRHRFRSELKMKVQAEVLDGIDGHAQAAEGREYGRVWPDVSLAAVSLIPPFGFDGRELMNASRLATLALTKQIYEVEWGRQPIVRSELSIDPETSNSLKWIDA
ncbi:hypothetical protein ASG47_07010 [Devosia sp. Leaf420]|uniref:DUF6538 domain-containing protein n=1 Tax=Devosia sp. Leaf420 TaxID=1736374 RepID=UPI0007124D8C|nr:DUF6538 domain-containing protein [Devosia sp. Leaf420]KQT48118.1 hypothetical protein ASG47_07010 [Devosia sp. Leaf420]